MTMLCLSGNHVGQRSGLCTIQRNTKTAIKANRGLPSLVEGHREGS